MVKTASSYAEDYAIVYVVTVLHIRFTNISCLVFRHKAMVKTDIKHLMPKCDYCIILQYLCWVSILASSLSTFGETYYQFILSNEMLSCKYVPTGWEYHLQQKKSKLQNANWKMENFQHRQSKYRINQTCTLHHTWENCWDIFVEKIFHKRVYFSTK